jgi:uncharacterized protein YjdB
MRSIMTFRFLAIISVAALAISCNAESAGPEGARVAQVIVSPTSSSLATGATLPLQASVRDADGNVLSGRKIFFASDNESVATVSEVGVVTARALGSAQIAVSSEGESAIAVITVVPQPVVTVTVLPNPAQTTIGSTVQLTAATYDGNNQLLANRAVIWSSSNSAVATVDQQGVVTGHGAGSAIVSATAEGKSGASSVTVTLVPVGSVTVNPATASLAPAQQLQLTATTFDATGNTLTGRAVSWSSNATGVATISQTGLVSAVAVGSAVITATSEGKSATAVVTVTPTAPPPPPPAPQIAKVTVTPNKWKPAVGQVLQFTARAFDSQDRQISNVTFTWSSTDIRRVTVTQTGLAVALSKGSADIRASAGGRSDKADVDVQ